MKIIPASIEILTKVDGDQLLKNIESYGRVCYKSEANITSTSAQSFIKKILESGHESVVEHSSITVKITCDRGVTHEIVRHRIASYSQESTRYCNYSKDKFGKELTFIRPCFWNENEDTYVVWKDQMQAVENSYLRLIDIGATPEEARSILPNSLKTEIIVTMNLREWRHFFKLRTSKRAHPQMREIAVELLSEMQKLIPVIFDDISPFS